MSQDIKLSVIPSKYAPIKESAVNSLKDLEDRLQGETINGFMFILFRPDGTYLLGQSAGMDRHKKIGILAEMMQELIRE